MAGRILANWLVLFTLSSTARATIVSNMTSGVTLFSDSFENQPLAAGFPTTANMSPGAPGASWSDGSDPSTMTATTEQAYLSNRSLKITRPSGSFTRIDGSFTNQTSGTLHAQFMLYVPSAGGASSPSVLLMGNWTSSYNSGSTLSMVPADNPGTAGTAVDSIRLGVGKDYNDPYFYSSTLWGAFQTDTWMHWEIIHAIGSSTITAKINGVTDSYTLSTPDNTVNFNQIEFFGSTAGNRTYYVDAVVVPEPSTALLFGSGLAILAWWRRGRARG